MLFDANMLEYHESWRRRGEYMTPFLRPLAIAVGLVASCACASAPALPDGLAVPAAAAAPKAPVMPAGATPVSDPAAAQVKAARALGYLPRRRAGVAVYCRKETVVGSRFTKDICIKEDQIADVVQRAINDRSKLEALQRECVGSGRCSQN